ncbi:sensor histidine kinase [Larkinella rosea]|uniref:histidine kinase n=1 Tax=Larkinella rosea TaxID=2025312 RepID=A0A3P1BBX6_9BACT|nr:sensor histidine kinase [Larkinella rosea]RRA98636.1 sensor histidine kinase [Larkinella rosea]
MDRFYIILLLLLIGFDRQLPAQSEGLSALSDSLAYLPAISKSEKFMELRASLHQAQVNHDIAELGEVCYRLGKFYTGVAYYKTGRYWFLQSLRIREPRGPSADLVKLYVQLSGSSYQTSGIEKRNHYIRLALKTAQNIHTPDSTKALESAYAMMGRLHMEACRQSSKKLVAYSDKQTNTLLSISPSNLNKEEACDSCFYYYRLARQKLRVLKDFNAIKDNLATICLLKGDTLQAIRYYKSLWVDQIRLKQTGATIITQANLAQLYISIKKPKQAQYLLDDALKKYNQYQLNSAPLLIPIYHNYFHLYRLTKNYSKAITYQDLSYGHQLKMVSEDRNGAIERLGVEYDAEKRDAEIKNQQKLIQVRDTRLAAERKVMYGLSGGLLMAIGVGIAFYRLNQKNRRISEHNAALVKEQNHRVKNNLQAVSDLLTLQKFQLTDKVAHEAITESQLRIQSIELLHKRLYDNAERLVAVELNRYIHELVTYILETYGLNYIDSVYQIDSIWLSADQMLPLGLILTETVTNSCKYAFLSHDTPRLTIQAQKTAATVRLIVQDNGPGFNLPQEEETTYGLKLIKIQAQQLHGEYTFRCDNGTRFELIFTLDN